MTHKEYLRRVNAIEFNGKFIQGHFIIGKTDPNKKILIDKKEVKVSKNGFFAFGIGKDRKYDLIITVGEKKIIKKIQKRKYNIQKIDGLPKKKVTPPEEFYTRIKKENKLIVDAREINSDLTFFKEKFILPVDNAIVTEDMKTLEIQCQGGGKVFVALAPITVDRLPYLKRAIEGRMAQAKEPKDKKEGQEDPQQ